MINTLDAGGELMWTTNTNLTFAHLSVTVFILHANLFYGFSACGYRRALVGSMDADKHLVKREVRSVEARRL